MIRRDGTEVPIEDSAAPILGEDGQLQRGVLVFRDATEHKRAEKAAESEQQRLRSLFLQTAAMVNIQTGPEHVSELAHPLMGALLGRDVTGLTARHAMPELEGQGVFELLDRVYQTGEPHIGTEVPTQLRLADGNLRPAVFNLVYQPWRNLAGEIAGVMTFAIEVTAQVDSRNREVALVEKLKRSEEEFRLLVENLPELAWSTQADGHIHYYNQHWYDYTGTTFEQREGWGWASVHAPETFPDVSARWKHSIAKGERFEMEFPLRGADGVFHWFLTRAWPLKDDSGEIIRWFGTNVNVDQQRRKSEELRQAVEVRDAFVSVASHGLKTPLTPLALRLQALARLTEPQTDSSYVRQVRIYSDTAKKQIHKLAALVNDLLERKSISRL